MTTQQRRDLARLGEADFTKEQIERNAGGFDPDIVAEAKEMEAGEARVFSVELETVCSRHGSGEHYDEEGNNKTAE